MAVDYSMVMAVKETAISKVKERTLTELIFRFGENLKGKFSKHYTEQLSETLKNFNSAQLTKPTSNKNLRQLKN
jgi:hypothetical protein